MNMRDELFSKWIAAMKEVKFPVATVDEVYAGLPKGADSNISVGGLVVCNTGDLFGRFIKPTDFPIESAEALATLVLDRAGL
ncbi:MTH865 family protein [Methanospirillum sp.]|uniref:MTH865 family protein n=1 Tax=Methanospirillum sp. TaxID=45200 RepID=UPI0035A0DD15